LAFKKIIRSRSHQGIYYSILLGKRQTTFKGSFNVCKKGVEKYQQVWNVSFDQVVGQRKSKFPIVQTKNLQLPIIVGGKHLVSTIILPFHICTRI
jgi:hypothetical protein